MKIFFILLILSLPAFAIDPLETLSNIRIKEVLPDNIVLLTRGTEDGIHKGDHARLVNLEGYAARAVCLSSHLERSYWKLYRIVSAETISKDFVYKMIGMNLSEIPQSMLGLKDEIFVSPIKDVDETKPATIKNDLPEKL